MIWKSLSKIEDFAGLAERAYAAGPLLMIYLDGVGMKQVREAIGEERLPYVADHFILSQMDTVPQAITNPAYASMISGVSPEVHGVFSHRDHILKRPTIFADKENAAIVEGDSRILKTEIVQSLNAAGPGEDIDRVVCGDALKKIQEGRDFILVHLHGVDDAGHEGGPEGIPYREALDRADGIIGELCQCFLTLHPKANVMLISDHGIHQEGKEGAHGSESKFPNPEDLLIPLGIYCDSKNYSIKKVSSGREDRDIEVKAFDLRDIAFTFSEAETLTFDGTDGFGLSVSCREIMEGGVLLSAYPLSLSYRLIFSRDPNSRRWCKEIEEISAN